MCDKLTEMLNQGQYEEVLTALEQYDISEYTESMIIIAISAFLALGDYETAKVYLQAGLRINPRNAELYLLLGNYYERYNKMQAYLCYENAELFCDNEQDRIMIRNFKSNLAEDGTLNYKKVAIVILSYNSYEMTQYCIESIRRNNLPSTYEIIVVDNASTDGIAEWLEQQEDIRLIRNSENRGFPYGCNQGIKAAHPEADIMLLNNDTIVFPNSLFWLRMGLYENTRVGMTGSITNHAGNGQAITEQFDSIQEYEKFALNNNVFKDNSYELKIFLVGFAILIRREVLDAVGLLDVRFSPGQFEDDDLGLRICSAGWKNILCHNSFIYHFGGGAGQNRSMWNKQFQVNKEKFRDKWFFDITQYTPVRKEIINLLNIDQAEVVNILEVGCGLGATLSGIQYRYPNARVYGIEFDPRLAEIGSRILNVVAGDINNLEIPFKDIKFDYIILSDVLEYAHDPEDVVQRLAARFKDGGGIFLCSVFNLMNISVLYPLIQGEFEYRQTGITNKSHLHFFTLNSISRLYAECGFQIDELGYTVNGIEEKDYSNFLGNILNMPGAADKDQFLAYKYIFRAIPKK